MQQNLQVDPPDDQEMRLYVLLRSLMKTWQPKLRRLSQLGKSSLTWALWMLPLGNAQWA